MQRKAIALLLAVTLGLIPASRALGSALGPDDVAAMVRALLSMVRIWNAMHGATYWDAPGTWRSAPPPYIPHIPPQPSASWGWHGLPAQGAWGGTGYPAAAPGQRLARHQAMARAAARHWQIVSDLTGTWQGASGDVLVIRGHRFRIHNGEGLYRDGTFQVVGNRLVTYVPTSGITRRYQFAHLGDRLALQDSEGRVLHFKKVGQSFPRGQKRTIM